MGTFLLWFCGDTFNVVQHLGEKTCLQHMRCPLCSNCAAQAPRTPIRPSTGELVTQRFVGAQWRDEIPFGR